ncbi:hypothetical protein OGATHE_004760 [Ogataea polymorpha]|uniref:Uncharacterized protein n=1 Tax=Ogataea polymorpha TaxID=460523 RepID=A0A9P8T2H4_9ASCO|nr:hypothetical protein OGATHE_004760 [Ogataea polymorpha]
MVSAPSFRLLSLFTLLSHSLYTSYAVVFTSGLSVMISAVLCLEQSSMKQSLERDPSLRSVPSTKIIFGLWSSEARSRNDMSFSLFDSNGVRF